jgi:hypothetical protein
MVRLGGQIEMTDRRSGGLEPRGQSETGSGEITVELALYGPVARAAGGHHVAQRRIQVKSGSTLGDLAADVGIDKAETGYIFVNAVLCDVPGLDVSHDLQLHDGDHIGVFSRVHMWPYQYRDGVRMTEALRKALQERGAMHHSYASAAERERSST